MKIISTLILVFGCGILAAQEPQIKDSTSTETKEQIVIDDEGIHVDTYSTQDDTLKSDTTRIFLKNAKITIVSNIGEHGKDPEKKRDQGQKYELTWWNGIDLGVNGILSSDYQTNLGDDIDFLEPRYESSRYISFNFAQLKGRLIGDYVGITTGLSVQFYNYKFGGDREFIFAGDSLFSTPTGDKNLTKNKLRATYIGIPVMLEFNTSDQQSRSFHISAGVVGKVLIGDMYKQKYDLEGESNKLTLKGDLGMNRWAADAMVRVGYGYFTLFAQVGLLPLFDNANTPDVHTASAGIFFKI